jgi:hypothetical protein
MEGGLQRNQLRFPHKVAGKHRCALLLAHESDRRKCPAKFRGQALFSGMHPGFNDTVPRIQSNHKSTERRHLIMKENPVRTTGEGFSGRRESPPVSLRSEPEDNSGRRLRRMGNCAGVELRKSKIRSAIHESAILGTQGDVFDDWKVGSAAV